MKINGTTQLLGLIGDPVSQARTPAMANELLERRNKLGAHVLVPMHVASEQLEQFLLGLRAMRNFGGAVVTMPHKTGMAALIDELTAESALMENWSEHCSTGKVSLLDYKQRVMPSQERHAFWSGLEAPHPQSPSLWQGMVADLYAS
eukprot:gene34865-42991_t